MHSLRTLAVLIAIFLTSPAGLNAECKRIQQDQGLYPEHRHQIITQSQTLWVYSIEIHNDDWKLAPYRHARGILSCEKCISSGLYKFYIPDDLNVFTDTKSFPATARARAERNFEVIGYPFQRLENDELELIEMRENIYLGDLKGYALRYKLHRQGADSWTYVEQIRSAKELIIIFASDDCLMFELKLEIITNDKKLRETLMDAVTNSISILKTREIRTPPSTK